MDARLSTGIVACETYRRNMSVVHTHLGLWPWLLSANSNLACGKFPPALGCFVLVCGE
jgi:hypothetical protein